jgi:hypothetical protein
MTVWVADFVSCGFGWEKGRTMPHAKANGVCSYQNQNFKREPRRLTTCAHPFRSILFLDPFMRLFSTDSIVDWVRAACAFMQWVRRLLP